MGRSGGSAETQIVRAIETLIRRQERIMIFIDGPNLYNMLRKLGIKIDYFKLVKELARGRTLIRTYMYITYNPENEDDVKKMESFARTLEEGSNFRIMRIPKHRRYVEEEGKHKVIWVEKGADVALVTDMLVLAFNDAYDTAVLVSGDTDFVRAIEAVQARGKKVEVAMFSHATGAELKRKADGFIPLEHLLGRVKFQ